MRLIHFSPEPLTLDRTWIYEDVSLLEGMKPNSLWVSDEDTDQGWYSWCISEGFSLNRLIKASEITLTTSANIYMITTVDQLDKFHIEFTAPISINGHISRVDWYSVKRSYQGIIITPYQWERRLSDLFWYYAWDCASGCIWDLTAIENVRALGGITTQPQPSEE